jgi:hypothetical protein
MWRYAINSSVASIEGRVALAQVAGVENVG